MKKVLSIVLSLTLVLGVFAFAGVEPSYAATKKPAKVSGVTIKKVSDTKIKVSWKKAKRAKKYKVYRKYYGQKKYKCVKTTKSRSYTTTQAQGKRYYYKVRGINGKKIGKFSATKSILIENSGGKDSDEVKCDTESLKFTTGASQKFTCTHPSSLKLVCKRSSDLVDVRKVGSEVNGADTTTTFEVSPYYNGTGKIYICDKSDSKKYFTIPITNDFGPIASSTESLEFTGYESQELTFLFRELRFIDIEYPKNVEVPTYSLPKIGMVTYVIRPLRNGTGKIKVVNRADHNIYKEVPFKIEFPQ